MSLTSLVASIAEAVERVPESAYSHIAPDDIGAEPVTLVPAEEGYQGVLVEVGLYNSDAETRTVTISDGTTIFRELHIAADGTVEVWLPDNLAWIGAENTAITITASVADKVQVTGGRYYYRAVSQ